MGRLFVQQGCWMARNGYVSTQFHGKFYRTIKNIPKYSWIELDLVRNTNDFRQESYKPRMGFDENIQVVGKIGTTDAWEARKQFVLKEVFTSMQDLISQAKSEIGKSLATFKPAEIVDFVIENEPEKDWKEKWLTGRGKRASAP